ncbi:MULTISPECIES: hypothetical protein [unclassified Streptomyces]|uniref:hypothetical protein n=1 Tax=unclassified Streptomyces TaxID=2593676 RepID=UPI0005ED0EA1|nr:MULTISPECIES: hypothetical protein [unclassified Streptomyces]APU41220.1 hypothetical protein BSL84_17120 [Streptomyces sp. TN58]KJK52469.1 hypothetical protein UK14_09025 [Streptomyces sp. NRRL F-4428]
MSETTAAPGRTWRLWLALYVTWSVVAGLVVVLLVLRSGADTTEAVLAGGGAFATTFGLLLAVPATVRELKRLG